MKRNILKIYKSNRAIEAQLLKDGKVLYGRKLIFSAKPTEDCFKFGEKFGSEIVKMKLESIVFDRNNSKYHGRVKSFAEGLRKSGVLF